MRHRTALVDRERGLGTALIQERERRLRRRCNRRNDARCRERLKAAKHGRRSKWIAAWPPRGLAHKLLKTTSATRSTAATWPNVSHLAAWRSPDRGPVADCIADAVKRLLAGEPFRLQSQHGLMDERAQAGTIRGIAGRYDAATLLEPCELATELLG